MYSAATLALRAAGSLTNLTIACIAGTQKHPLPCDRSSIPTNVAPSRRLDYSTRAVPTLLPQPPWFKTPHRRIVENGATRTWRYGWMYEGGTTHAHLCAGVHVHRLGMSRCWRSVCMRNPGYDTEPASRPARRGEAAS